MEEFARAVLHGARLALLVGMKAEPEIVVGAVERERAGRDDHQQDEFDDRVAALDGRTIDWPRMRCFPGIVVLLSLVAAPAAAKPHPADAFVLAGQSNAVGWSTQFENQTTARVTSPSPTGLS